MIVGRLRPGRIITIPEEHYCYGTGDLTLRLTEPVLEPPPGVEWLTVRGVEQLWQCEGGVREVLVRVAELQRLARRG